MRGLEHAVSVGVEEVAVSAAVILLGHVLSFIALLLLLCIV